MPSGDYRIRLYGDVGNIHQFGSSVVGVLSQIKAAMRSAAVSPVTSRPPIAGMDTSRITTSIDTYNRTLIQSGQVFHRYVAGYTADLARLDAATTKSGRGYSGISFKTPLGPSVYGSAGTGLTGKAAAVGTTGFAKNFKPVYEELYSGEFKSQMGNLDRIMAAQKQLVPMAKQIDALSKQAEIRAKGFEAKALTFSTAAGQAQAEQAAMMAGLRSAQTAFGGTAPKYDRSGALTAPAFYQSGEQEVNRLAKTPYYRGIQDKSDALVLAAQRRSGISSSKLMELTGAGKGSPGDIALTSLLSTVKAGDKVSDKTLKDIIRIGIAGNTSATPVAGLQKAIMQSRDIVGLETAISEHQAYLRKVEMALKKLEMQVKSYDKGMYRKIQQVRKGFSAELKELDLAQTQPFVPKQLDDLFKKIPRLRKDFVKNMGFTAPYGTQEFAKQFQEKGITANITKDLSRGVYKLSGDMRDQMGIVGQWSGAYDEAGRKVERFTGSLRNTGGFLKQTAVDFRKVVEWTIATTAVFGTIGLVISSFSKINQVNADLQRFQITAKTTGEQTDRAFKTITNVAIRTATPLGELVAVMDDIALATRKTTQTTDEWAKGMEDLAEAVGILTNITGMETVRATDLLSSAYKQLRVDTDQLVPLLNKITAVGGGNAQAIEDITQAIGGLAEAAKAAGLTLDQQIAAVQTLSQVTNKTAADTATAFKNLFGAINAPASEKMLKTFGINIRNAAGGLRPFLDIYSDIYDSMQAGIIPEGRVQDVLRAISGGPRRAPDAAALLGNLPRVFETMDISINATNEALIANAQIMDTNKAKLQQIRTAFDAALIEKFTEAVNKLVAVLVDFGNTLNSIFGGFSSTLFSGIGQLAILLIGITALTKASLAFKGVWLGIRKEFSAIGVASKDLAGMGKAERYLGTRVVNTATEKLPPIAGFRRYGTGTNQHYVPIKSVSTGDALKRSESVALAQSQAGGYTPIRNPRVGPRLPQPPLPPIGGYVIKTMGGKEVYAPIIDKTPVISKGPLGIQNVGDTPILATTGLQSRAVGTGLGLLGSRAGRFGGAAALGIAGGAAMGGLGVSPALGQMGGMLLASMAGGPVGVTAGLALTGISTVIQLMGEEAEKAKAKLSENRNAAYALTQAIEAQATATRSSETSQREAEQTLRRLSFIQNKDTEQKAAQVAAQEKYVNATLELASARQVLNEKEEELLAILPQLGENYEKFADALRNGLLTDTDRQEMGVQLAKDILQKQGIPYFEDIKDYFAPPKRTTYGAEFTPGVVPYGMVQEEVKVPASEIIGAIEGASREDRWKEAAAFLKDYGPEGDKTALGGSVAVTPQLISTLYRALNTNISEETSNNEEFLAAVELFGTFIRDYGAINTSVRARFAVQASEARTTSDAAVGKLKGIDLIERQVRDKIAKGMLDAFEQQVPGETWTDRAAQDLANEKLTQGIGKFVTGEGPVSRAEVSSLYDQYLAVSGLSDEFDKSKESTDLYYISLKTLIDEWTGGTAVIADLTDGVKGYTDAELEAIEVENRLVEIRKGLTENFSSTAQDLGKQLADLQAAYQGGDISYSQWKGQSAELKEYIKLNMVLRDTLKNDTEPELKEMASALGHLNGLYGIQYQSVDQLNAAIMAWAQTMGLSAPQIAKLKDQIIALDKAMAILHTLKTVKIKATVEVIAKKKGYDDSSGPEADEPGQYTKDPAYKSVKDQIAEAIAELDKLWDEVESTISGGNPNRWDTSSAGSTKDTGVLDIPDEWEEAGVDIKATLAQAVANAKKYQSQIPGEDKEHAKDLVAVMDDNKRILLQKGISEEYLRKAIDDLTEEMKKANDLAKADTIGRIRVGAGDFAALANVPLNRTSGISVGSPEGPISINLNMNGQLLTPAQFDQLANQIAAALKSKINAA